jgi:hypothetical protein
MVPKGGLSVAKSKTYGYLDFAFCTNQIVPISIAEFDFAKYSKYVAR